MSQVLLSENFTSATPSITEGTAKKRLYYLDNLRGALTILVLFHHTAIAYGGSGGWYFKDPTVDGSGISGMVLSLFTAVNQAFFMGLFFFISAYFVPGSYDRKGPVKFVADRFLRLGVPILVYLFGIAPALNYWLENSSVETFWQFYSTEILTLKYMNFGPQWFTEALVYFTILYVAWRLFTKPVTRWSIGFPPNRMILVYAVAIGIIAFVVRLGFPTGTGFLELQLGYFPAYICLFIFGLIAYRSNGLEQITGGAAKRWLWIAIACIPALPVAFLIAQSVGMDTSMLNGGMNWLALTYAMWEPFVCIGLCMWSLVLFRGRWNQTSRFRKFLADNAFTVYIIHPPIIVAITKMMVPVDIFPLVKWAITACLSVAVSFALAALIRRVPGATRVV